MSLSAILDFFYINLKFCQLIGSVHSSVCAIMPNFLAIGQPVAKIWRFFDTQKVAIRHFALLKIRNFNGITGRWKLLLIKETRSWMHLLSIQPLPLTWSDPAPQYPKPLMFDILYHLSYFHTWRKVLHKTPLNTSYQQYQLTRTHRKMR